MIWLTALALLGQPAVAGAEGAIEVYLSRELGVGALSEVPAALGRPFDAKLGGGWKVKMPGGPMRPIETCRDFLPVATVRFKLPNEADWGAWWYQGAHCFALDALQRAKPAVRSYLGWFQVSRKGVARLPPGMAMLIGPDDADEATEAAKACRGWGSFDGALQVRIATTDTAELRSDGWTGRLVLYARADIDGDGLEDLLIRRDAHVIGGSAAESTVFVVTQSSRTGCARVARVMGEPDAP
jgi:hypothetical protein